MDPLMQQMMARQGGQGSPLPPQQATGIWAPKPQGGAPLGMAAQPTPPAAMPPAPGAPPPGMAAPPAMTAPNSDTQPPQAPPYMNPILMHQLLARYK